MGAVPKHRPSKMSIRKRRTHYKLAPVPLAKCAQCLETKLSHRVCPACGYYNRKTKVLDIEEK